MKLPGWLKAEIPTALMIVGCLIIAAWPGRIDASLMGMLVVMLSLIAAVWGRK